MIRDVGSFSIKLLGFSLLLFFVHYYILAQFFTGELYLPLWAIYCFNAAMVLLVFLILRYYSRVQPANVLKYFLLLTLLKMALAIVFLLPVFLKKSAHAQLEIFNFFIPYFLFLIFEITGLSKFLQKS
ncbi:MAG: hypothetical protein KJN76_02550 [Eudoraea sp.]|nr:hypothetical protein [Eudoraea sp.]